jgi:Na+-transporting methylmalonyl-CoA/oxaloacetate decarboxylase beta subunit
MSKFKEVRVDKGVVLVQNKEREVNQMASKTLVILLLGALAWQSLFSGNVLMALFFILFDLYLISE